MVKKNLFNFDMNNSSNVNGSLAGQITCEPCASECEKIKIKINNRKLSDIKDEDAAHIISPFNINV
jgi:hypothetical protein